MNERIVTGIKEQYSRYTTRRLLFIAIFAVALVFMSLISITVGTRSLSIEQVYSLLIDHLQGAVYDRTLEYDLWYDDNIVWNYRLPRVIFAIIAGASLSVAGAPMQSVMKIRILRGYRLELYSEWQWLWSWVSWQVKAESTVSGWC